MCLILSPQYILNIYWEWWPHVLFWKGFTFSSSVLLAPQHDPVPKTHTAGGGWYLKCAPTPASLVLKNALKSQAWWYTPAISVNGQERKPKVQGPQRLVTAWPSEIVWNKQTNRQLRKGNKTPKSARASFCVNVTSRIRKHRYRTSRRVYGLRFNLMPYRDLTATPSIVCYQPPYYRFPKLSSLPTCG